MGPSEEWVQELGDALQWADLSMGKSRHMSWAFIDEHYWTLLLNAYVPILRNIFGHAKNQERFPEVFAARIGTWWSQLTQMMPFGNRAWPGNPRSIEAMAEKLFFFFFIAMWDYCRVVVFWWQKWWFNHQSTSGCSVSLEWRLDSAPLPKGECLSPVAGESPRKSAGGAKKVYLGLK